MGVMVTQLQMDISAIVCSIKQLRYLDIFFSFWVNLTPKKTNQDHIFSSY